MYGLIAARTDSGVSRPSGPGTTRGMTPESAAIPASHVLDRGSGMNEAVLANAGKSHLLLAVAPLPRIEQVYQAVYERILNEKVTTDPVTNHRAATR